MLSLSLLDSQPQNRRPVGESSAIGKLASGLPVARNPELRHPSSEAVNDKLLPPPPADYRVWAYNLQRMMRLALAVKQDHNDFVAIDAVMALQHARLGPLH